MRDASRVQMQMVQWHTTRQCRNDEVGRAVRTSTAVHSQGLLPWGSLMPREVSQAHVVLVIRSRQCTLQNTAVYVRCASLLFACNKETSGQQEGNRR